MNEISNKARIHRIISEYIDSKDENALKLDILETALYIEDAFSLKLVDEELDGKHLESAELIKKLIDVHAKPD